MSIVQPELSFLEAAGASVTPTSLTFSDLDVSWEAWKNLGRYLGMVHQASRFWLGDWCNAGERLYGETYAQAVEVTGLSKDTLMTYAWVARSVPISNRLEILSFSHHIEIAALEASKQIQWLQRARDEGWSRRELHAALNGKSMDVHYSSETDDWATPQALYDLLDSEFHFTLDVCATEDNAKCEQFFAPSVDGLTQEWTGTCWMNPPYGDVILDWVEKAWLTGQQGHTVVCLLPARVDTGWWWNYARFGEIRFLRGRLKFGDGANSAPFPSAVVIFPRTAQTVWWEAWP